MKILAIDIGTAHIKSVIVETKFKNFNVVLHDITSVPDAWDPVAPGEQLLTDGQLATLAEIKQRYGAGVDRIVTNLPYSLYSSRFQTFPLKDKRKVEAAIKFAIEDEIPFDLDECIVTSQLYPAPNKAKETRVLTGFAPVEALERFLNGISAMGLSPDCLMMEEAALASQFQRAKGEKHRNVAVLNLGHRKSGMFFFRDGLPVLHRNSMAGGYQITEAIATRYSLGLAEAELAKVDRGFLAVPGMQLSPDQEAFSETIRGALDPVFMDFQQSLMAFTSRYAEPLEAIYVCGGTSLLPGLPEFLAHFWQQKVLPLQVTRLYPQFPIQPPRNAEALLPVATALGISQAGGEGRSPINFRSGRLHAASAGLQLNFRQFVYPAQLALVVYLVAILSVLGQTFFLGAQRSQKEAQLTSVMRRVLTGSPPSLLNALKSNPARLRSTVERKLEEQRIQLRGAGSGGGSQALEFLHELSRAVPKSITTEIKVMEYEPTRVSLTMESPAASADSALSTLLQQTTLLENAKASPLETKGTRKRFSVTATLNPKRGT